MFCKQTLFSLVLLTGLSLNAMQQIGQTPVYIPEKTGVRALIHNNKGFHVVDKENKVFTVQPAFVSEQLRKLSSNELNTMLSTGKIYLKVSKFDNSNDYGVELKGRVKGGGIWGATIGALFGKCAVSVVGHGTIQAIAWGVGIFCPPAGVAVGISLETSLGPLIEAASVKGALIGGMAGAVATGPV